MSDLERHKQDLQKLIGLGNDLMIEVTSRDSGEYDNRRKFEDEYQRWYTESCMVIKQLLPERLMEFEFLYQGDARRKQIVRSTYTIRDWLLRLRTNASDIAVDLSTAVFRFHAQLSILKSAQARFDSSLFDIRQVLQADLFESELDAARELSKKGFGRAAGAVAGVVLEGHLRQVLETHNIKLSIKRPKISNLNDALKENDVLDFPKWRHIQMLGDIRNLCDHKGEKEPTKDEIGELIDGVDKCTKTIF